MKLNHFLWCITLRSIATQHKSFTIAGADCMVKHFECHSIEKTRFRWRNRQQAQRLTMGPWKQAENSGRVCLKLDDLFVYFFWKELGTFGPCVEIANAQKPSVLCALLLAEGKKVPSGKPWDISLIHQNPKSRFRNLLSCWNYTNHLCYQWSWLQVFVQTEKFDFGAQFLFLASFLSIPSCCYHYQWGFLKILLLFSGKNMPFVALSWRSPPIASGNMWKIVIDVQFWAIWLSLLSLNICALRWLSYEFLTEQQNGDPGADSFDTGLRSFAGPKLRCI